MKTNKTNHSEVVKSLKAELGQLICKRDGYERAWVGAMKCDDPWQQKYWELWKEFDTKVKELKPILKFHEIMAAGGSEEEITKKLEAAGFKVDYVTKKDGRLYAAVFLEEVRLIDNIAI